MRNMNLNAVYELRNRLEASAVAGIDLIRDDFRLQRAVEQIAPLAKAVPVFQKIEVLAKKVVAEECTDRAGLLLDLLALLDAVICTQGTMEIEGEILELCTEPEDGQKDTVLESSGTLQNHRVFPERRYTGIAENVPYSRMAPLMEALSGIGSGRYEVIHSTYEKDPELFQDYRIQKLLVKALGDSYFDIADMAEEWLSNMGSEIVPLLKQDFHGDGKREMVRRIHVMESIAGAQENVFYRSLLEDSGKDVKKAAIEALRHDPSNMNLLLGLVQSERGKLKEAAQSSLVFMNGEEAIAYWKHTAEKDPEKTAGFLSMTREDWASDLLADLLNRHMEALDRKIPRICNEAEKETFYMLLEASEAKHSEKLCLCYEKALEWFPKKVGEVLINSLLSAPHPNLFTAADKLYKKRGDKLLNCAFLAALLSLSPEEVYERFHQYAEPLESGDCVKDSYRNPAGIFEIFIRMNYNEKSGKLVLYGYEFPGMEAPFVPDDVYENLTQRVQVLEQGLDSRWYQMLFADKRQLQIAFQTSKKLRRYQKIQGYRSGWDAMLACIYRPGSPERDRLYGKYFYESARENGLTVGDIQMLKKCGWPVFYGLLSCYRDERNNGGGWELHEILMELPFDKEELAEELKPLLHRADSGDEIGAGRLRRWYEELKNGASIENLW